jgi:hypothetical protein
VLKLGRALSGIREMTKTRGDPETKENRSTAWRMLGDKKRTKNKEKKERVGLAMDGDGVKVWKIECPVIESILSSMDSAGLYSPSALVVS